jgi:hypothetical protein
MGKTNSQMLAFGERRATISTIHAVPNLAELVEQMVGVTIVGFGGGDNSSNRRSHDGGD